MFAMHATVALAPAASGWTVTATHPSTGDPAVYPVIAWASVVTGFDSSADPATEIHPVFVAEGQVWTGPQYPLGPSPIVNAPTAKESV